MVARSCACGCGLLLPEDAHGNRKYVGNHGRRVEKRRERARERGLAPPASALVKPTSPQTREYLTADEQADGRTRARRGALYEEFRHSHPNLARRLIDVNDPLGVNEVADMVGTSPANVSRWVTALREDLSREEMQRNWKIDTEDKDALDGGYRSFVERFHPETEVRWYDEEWEEAVDEVVGSGGKLLLLAPQRHGKLLADSTPILTPEGWRTHGDLSVGDRVFAPDGMPTTVIAVKPKAMATMEVEFSDGSIIKCHPEHLWTVYDRGLRRYVTRETQQLVGRLEMHGRRNLLVDWTEPILAPEAALPIDPYFLGVWLGDGKADGISICGEPTDLAAIELELKVRGIEASWRTTHADTGVDYLGFKGYSSAWRSLGLLNDKHIPDVYFTASEAQRRDLLAGLVDTDGSVEPGGRVRFVTCDDRLRDDVIRLVSTFGYRAGVHTVPPTTSSSGVVGRKDVHYIQWTPHDGRMQGWAIDRKRVVNSGKVRHDRRSIVDIRPTDSPEPGHCIAVDHPDELYLAGDRLVPTHNTNFLALYCIRRITQDPNIRILWVGRTQDEAADSVGYIRQLLEDEKYTESVLGPGRSFRPPARGKGAHSWTDTRFTVSTRERTLRAPTMRAVGIGQTISGRDADLIIIDDPQEREDIDAGATAGIKQKKWFFTTFMSRKMPHTGIAYITSRKHVQDIPGAIIERKKGDWEVKVYHGHDPACLEPEDEPDKHTDCVMWPSERPFSHLMSLKDDDEVWFECNIQNNPTADRLVLTSKEKIAAATSREVMAGHFPPGWSLIAGFDPASGKDNAATLWAYTPKGAQAQIVTSKKFRAGPAGMAEALAEFYDRFHCVQWVTETNWAGGFLEDVRVQKLVREKNIRITPHQTKGNKTDYSGGVTSMIQTIGAARPDDSQPIIFPTLAGDEDSNGVRELIGELLFYNPDANKHAKDDRVLAMWFPWWKKLLDLVGQRSSARAAIVEYDDFGSLGGF